MFGENVRSVEGVDLLEKMNYVQDVNKFGKLE
ncbi:unnamed protein product, partial [marine sediment metagenome]